MILIAIILLIFLAVLLIIPCLRVKIVELIKNILKELKFKTTIVFVTAEFLDFSFSVVT